MGYSLKNLPIGGQNQQKIDKNSPDQESFPQFRENEPIETGAPWTLFSALNFGMYPDNKDFFRNAHVRKFKQLSSYIAVKAEILVVFLRNEI